MLSEGWLWSALLPIFCCCTHNLVFRHCEGSMSCCPHNSMHFDHDIAEINVLFIPQCCVGLPAHSFLRHLLEDECSAWPQTLCKPFISFIFLEDGCCIELWRPPKPFCLCAPIIRIQTEMLFRTEELLDSGVYISSIRIPKWTLCWHLIPSRKLSLQVSDIDGGVIKLVLEGACGTCPSSTMTVRATQFLYISGHESSGGCEGVFSQLCTYSEIVRFLCLLNLRYPPLRGDDFRHPQKGSCRCFKQ